MVAVRRRRRGPIRALRVRARNRLKTDPALARRVLPWTERIRTVPARLRPREPERPLERIVFHYGRNVPDAAFVQVGAHDGTQLDPLRETVLSRRWQGIMVEPVPYVFERLDARYRANPRIRLENVAVADRDGTLPFHHLAPADADDDVWIWYDALGSFKRDVVLSHTELIDDVAQRIVTVEVPTVTFETLLARNGYDHVDVLLVDTEGYDREILDRVDLASLGTDLVIFEHLHLDRADRDHCRALLEGHGFEQISDFMDTIAVTSRALELPGMRTVFDEAGAVLEAEFEQ